MRLICIVFLACASSFSRGLVDNIQEIYSYSLRELAEVSAETGELEKLFNSLDLSGREPERNHLVISGLNEIGERDIAQNIRCFFSEGPCAFALAEKAGGKRHHRYYRFVMRELLSRKVAANLKLERKYLRENFSLTNYSAGENPLRDERAFVYLRKNIFIADNPLFGLTYRQAERAANISALLDYRANKGKETNGILRTPPDVADAPRVQTPDIVAGIRTGSTKHTEALLALLLSRGDERYLENVLELLSYEKSLTGIEDWRKRESDLLFSLLRLLRDPEVEHNPGSRRRFARLEDRTIERLRKHRLALIESELREWKDVIETRVEKMRMGQKSLMWVGERATLRPSDVHFLKRFYSRLTGRGLEIGVGDSPAAAVRSILRRESNEMVMLSAKVEKIKSELSCILD